MPLEAFDHGARRPVEPAGRLPKSGRTKAHVLGRAVELASRVGFEGLSFGSLAEHAGLSKSGLFAHFRSKEDLQIETLELASQQFLDGVVRPAIDKAPRGLARIRAFFDGWMEWIGAGRQKGGDILIGAAFEFDDAPPGPMRDAVVRGHRRMNATIVRMAALAIEAGDLRSDLDPDQFGFEFLGIIHAYHHERRLLGNEQPARYARIAFERLIDAYRKTPARSRAARK